MHSLSRSSCSTALFFLAFFLTPTLSAVSAAPGLLMLEHPSRLSFTGFGSSLAVVGDIDGDQTPDYLVGAYQHGWQDNLKQGRAFVFSGQSGKLLYTLDNPHPQPDAGFGVAVAAAGDINQDGITDLIVGAFGQGEKDTDLDLVRRSLAAPGEEEPALKDAGSGQAFVFSGKDGQLLQSLEAPQQQKGAGFGWEVASAGDLTQDNIPELLVGAIGQAGSGRVFVFNGHDGSLLRILAPPPPASAAVFGRSITGTGDLNADGVPDILVGAPYTSVGKFTVQGQVHAFSGQDGSLLYTIDDPTPRPGAVFGWHVTASGDFNQDGVSDVLVGAPYKDSDQYRSHGAAFVFSGIDGSLIYALKSPGLAKPYATFGYRLNAVPDLNGDNIPEVLVSAPFQTVDALHLQGEVFLFNGHDGRHLATFDNPAPHQGSTFGYAMASPGDVDGDELPDFAIGAAGQTIRDRVAVGRVYLFRSRQ